MPAVATFDQALTQSEQQLIASLSTPSRIQAFLDELTYGTGGKLRAEPVQYRINHPEEWRP